MARKCNFLAAFLLITVAIAASNAARILSVFPSPSKSHLLIHLSLAETLAEQGHDVTVLATIPNVKKNAKYTYIHIKGEGTMFNDAFAKEMISKPAPIYQKFASTVRQVMHMANETMNNRHMQDFLRNHKAGDYDLLILGYFMNDFMLGLGAHFQCPIVVSFMVRPVFSIDAMVGNPAEASYVSSLFVGHKQPMNFWQRLHSFLGNAFEYHVFAPIMNRQMEKLYRYNFPADRYPPLEEVAKNVSLVFTNHHFSQGPIRPNVPALIEIGGIQIKEKSDPLPKEIAEILDSAKNGVIYFSLGTNVQGSNLSKEKAKMIFNVLSKLPYTCLLKWGDSDFPGQAPNIFYKSWLPQDDVLAHPKVKLFITHGGQGSVVESQYHGVPMVGIPFFGDQHSNMANVENSGFGLRLNYATMTEEDLRVAIERVLQNPQFTKNVQQFSKLYRDRPMTPRQLVRYWVDYVLRHNGAKHLQSPAVHMNWWQLHSVDVIGFLLAVIVAVVAIFVGICKCLCCGGQKKAAKKESSRAKKNK